MDKNIIAEAAKIINEGGLVAFPTETVYGLGANALNPEAVAQIFLEKERPSFDPLIVHIADVNDIRPLVKEFDPRIEILAKHFWPGPLTIVVPKSDLVPDIVSSGLPTIALRMPNNKIALSLIKESACPIAAPSANKFGMLSPTSADHVRKQLKNVKCVIDGGETTIGIESTVIALHSKGFQVLRPGIITKSEIEKYIPYFEVEIENLPEMASPGLMKSHYSPNKPLFISLGYPENIDISKAARLSFSGIYSDGYKIIEHLSKNKNLKEAAVNLFKALHKLEESDVECIIVEPLPEEGIGIAIMDRLKKAAYRFTIDNFYKSI